MVLTNPDSLTAEDAPVEPARAPESMGGLAKGLAILETFAGGRAPLRISEAAIATGTTRAAARRCLRTLVELGYVRQDGVNFVPTPRLVRLASSYLEVDPLPALARPHLNAARDELGESVSLAVLDDGSSLFVARAEADHIVLASVRVGSQLPAYGSSTGRVLLAGLPDDQLDRYLAACKPEARTPMSVVDKVELRSLVLAVRWHGYAYTDDELELGMRSVAVPVVDSRGTTRAALSSSAFVVRSSLETMINTFAPVLVKHAHDIGRML